jgi:hypothetical protein
MFENSAPRRIFGPETEEVAGEWGKTAQNIIRVMKSYMMMREIKNAFDILGGKPEGKSLLRRSGLRWKELK